MTYGNTSLQIALFPLWNSYQLPHHIDAIGNSRPRHRVRELVKPATQESTYGRHYEVRPTLSADTVDRHFDCRLPTLTADKVMGYTVTTTCE